jgi:prefoldin subunit 5
LKKRREQLQQRLNGRNQALDKFMKDARKVRSYLVRSSQPNWGHATQRGYVLYGKDDISSEEQQEIAQLCQRIFEIEQELHRLALMATHLDDNQVFELSFDELVGYGFD